MESAASSSEGSTYQPRAVRREDAISNLSTYAKLMRQRTLSDSSSKMLTSLAALSSRQAQTEEDYFNTSTSTIPTYGPTVEQLRLGLDQYTSSSPTAAELRVTLPERSGRRAADYAKRRAEYSRQMAESCITQNGRRLKGHPTVQWIGRHCTVHNTALTRPVADKLAEVLSQLKFRTCWLGWVWSNFVDNEVVCCDLEQQREDRKASLEAAGLLN
ncbi:hypothetical protein EJ03DRAFT_356415 [Teratosphaeria nubilosa]|uniref:Uncharacterized protein n=1 Tax=Teratosphaeria nubilosa TaxID=161662 RepID=A0A6G1KSX0_9PEZI|nr:hypothetical protein EJ03DRAFT_356415 [Teratosphaeria nubilosa]